MTPQDMDIIQTKQSCTRIHYHRKMHRLLTTICPNSNIATNAFAIIQRLVSNLIFPFVSIQKRLRLNPCGLLPSIAFLQYSAKGYRNCFFIPVVPWVVPAESSGQSPYHLSYELRVFHYRYMKQWLRLSYAQN
ncbi:hypothetical protein T09_11382 [Trichinella sp. T9]|nr:hypothetical protein T09_11382 [Trichinella sp. T9]